MGNVEGVDQDQIEKAVEFQKEVLSEMGMQHNLTFLVRDGLGCWKEFPANVKKSFEISPKFKELAGNNDNKSKNAGIIYTIRIDDISAELFDRILKYSYGFDTEIDSTMLWPLRYISSKYLIKDLIDDIDELLLSHLTPENFCKTYLGYSSMKDFKLLQECVDSLKNLHGDHTKIIKSKHFLKLRINPDLRLLLQSRDLDVDEEIIWKRCVEWARSQKRMPEKIALRQIALYIEFGLMNKRYLEHNVYPIIEESPDEIESLVSDSSSSLNSESEASQKIFESQMTCKPTFFETIPTSSPMNAITKKCYNAASIISGSPVNSEDLKAKYGESKESGTIRSNKKKDLYFSFEKDFRFDMPVIAYGGRSPNEGKNKCPNQQGLQRPFNKKDLCFSFEKDFRFDMPVIAYGGRSPNECKNKCPNQQGFQRPSVNDVGVPLKGIGLNKIPYTLPKDLAPVSEVKNERCNSKQKTNIFSRKEKHDTREFSLIKSFYDSQTRQLSPHPAYDRKITTEPLCPRLLPNMMPHQKIDDSAPFPTVNLPNMMPAKKKTEKPMTLRRR